MGATAAFREYRRTGLVYADASGNPGEGRGTMWMDSVRSGNLESYVRRLRKISAKKFGKISITPENVISPRIYAQCTNVPAKATGRFSLIPISAA